MQALRRKWRHHGPAKQARAYTELNHGRWIIPCPFCPSAAPDIGRDRFLCSECGNAAAGGRYVPVERPHHELSREIARLTTLRPDNENRNWQPGETADMLAADNLEHGIAC
jgi:ribosomal protein L37AE/L43A